MSTAPSVRTLVLCILFHFLQAWNITSNGFRTEEEIRQIEKDCNKTFRIEKAYLESLFISASFPDEMDPTPKCYIRCLLQKIAVVSEDGLFDPDEGVNVFLGAQNENNQNVVTRCSIERNILKINGRNYAVTEETCKCERSYKFYSCLIESKIKEDSPCLLFDHSCLSEGLLPP